MLQNLCEMDKTSSNTNYILSQDELTLFIDFYSFFPEVFRKEISDKVYAISVIDGQH